MTTQWMKPVRTLPSSSPLLRISGCTWAPSVHKWTFAHNTRLESDPEDLLINTHEKAVVVAFPPQTFRPHVNGKLSHSLSLTMLEKPRPVPGSNPAPGARLGVRVVIVVVRVIEVVAKRLIRVVRVVPHHHVPAVRLRWRGFCARRSGLGLDVRTEATRHGPV